MAELEGLETAPAPPRVAPPAAPKKAASGTLGPGDVESLLNTLGSIHEPAPPPPRPKAPPTPKAAAPKVAPAAVDDLLKGIGPFGEAPAPEHRAEPDVDSLLDGLEEIDEEEVPLSAEADGPLLKVPEIEAPATPPPPQIPFAVVDEEPAPSDELAPPALGAEGAWDLGAVAETAIAVEQEQAPGPMNREYGPYRLLEKIAVGGMAEVFRAKRPGVEGFEKILAVKRILPHLSDNKEFVDMFINEAKMVAGLSHPNIVQIFDLGKIDKSYYIAMEYVPGKDLRSIQRRAQERSLKIPLDISAHMIGKVCLALEYAHRKKDEGGRPMKIVHRDVSPQNVLIAYEGEVKLTDFGIAKAATKAPTTDSGALRGKLLYMSPEQAWGRPIDRRSDLFSLGIILYELVSEQKPFLSNSEVSILELVRECKIAPPRSLNPKIPERLEAVVMKALAREPDDRYQDAGEMYRDLERAVPERKAPTGNELARFMEILFETDEPKREAFEEPLPDEGGIEIELEATAKNAPTPPAPRQDPMSIEKLLARFGIK
jgi:serine/threonine protein kinase